MQSNKLKIRKRDGKEVEFDATKIKKALTSANNSISENKLQPYQIDTIVIDILHKVNSMNNVPTVDDIQSMIIKEIVSRNKPELAEAYITYKYQHDEMRSGNSYLLSQVNSLLAGTNQDVIADNSNKSPTHHNVARDYMAGFVCKEIAKNNLPADIWDAHKEGTIHFHDADYSPAMAMHNCFRRSTKFVTNKGIKSFDDFNDGDSVVVSDRYGVPRVATVHNYGKRKFNKITFKLRSGRTYREIYATPDHRWYLLDGSVTTDLKVGDWIFKHPNINFDPYNCTKDELDYWTFGFVLGDGSDYWRGDCGVQLLLCGDKEKYEDLFLKAGYIHKKSNWLYKYGTIKSEFIDNKYWRGIPDNCKIALFNGYFAADGSVMNSRLSTVNPVLHEMIIELADFSRYYTFRDYYHERESNYGPISDFCTHFSMGEISDYYGWKVDSIEETNIEEDAWCVTEPVTHSFMLESGIVTGNCDLLDIADMLNNNTEMGGTYIHTPHSLATAMTVATQISMNVSSAQYGGQTISLTHLAPFINTSRQKLRKEVSKELTSIKDIFKGGDKEFKKLVYKIAEDRLRKEIESAVQTLQYQEITCASSNGQSPFITIFMYLNEPYMMYGPGKEYPNIDPDLVKKDLALLIEEVLKQRIKGIQASDGSWVAPVFPKLIYVLEDDNIEEGQKYYYLTELARDCTMKRMVPDYVSEKMMKELRGECFSSMGCRSQIGTFYPKDHPECILEYGDGVSHPKDYVKMVNKKWYPINESIHYSRFNMGVVTINLPDVALSVLRDLEIDTSLIGRVNLLDSNVFDESDIVNERFWELLSDRLELCHKALRLRYERLRGTSSNVAPILWQAGALARLGPGEVIDPLLRNGWSTISLGYVGLYETVKALTGHSHTDEIGREVAMSIMQRLHDICNEWKMSEPEKLGYSLYGTPEENLTNKMAKSLQNRFGIIKGITDKSYVTNSYHVPVFEEIDAFSKLAKEAPFQDLSSGGNISYVELPSMNKNPDALMKVIKYIYDTNIYAEVNTKLDHCMVCKFDGEIQLKSTSFGSFKLVCPNCGNDDARKMYVVRRICGYIGRIDAKDNPINPNPSSSDGRLGDIHDRVTHL